MLQNNYYMTVYMRMVEACYLSYNQERLMAMTVTKSVVKAIAIKDFSSFLSLMLDGACYRFNCGCFASFKQLRYRH